eukprot:Pgem_evm6s19777
MIPMQGICRDGDFKNSISYIDVKRDPCSLICDCENNNSKECKKFEIMTRKSYIYPSDIPDYFFFVINYGKKMGGKFKLMFYLDSAKYNVPENRETLLFTTEDLNTLMKHLKLNVTRFRVFRKLYVNHCLFLLLKNHQTRYTDYVELAVKNNHNVSTMINEYYNVDLIKAIAKYENITSLTYYNISEKKLMRLF